MGQFLLGQQGHRCQSIKNTENKKVQFIQGIPAIPDPMISWQEKSKPAQR